jgi:hypothetical protein
MNRNNLCAAAPLMVDLAGSLDKGLDGLKECFRPETAANNQPANPVSDVNQPVDDFDLWRLFKQYCAVESPHALTSPNSLVATEQVGNEPENLNERKPLTPASVPFLSTVPFRRRAAGSVASSNPVELTTLPTPANDNDRPWHPLDDAA